MLSRSVHSLLRCAQTLESLDNGKVFTSSVGDMMFIIKILRFYAGAADKLNGSTVPVGE